MNVKYVKLLSEFVNFVLFFVLGDCWEGPEGEDWRFGQEEVPGAVWFDRRAVLLPHPEAYSFEAWGRFVLLC